jgi:hypothetical protein
MKLFNKTAIAIVLSLLGAASSVSALAMATDNTKVQVIEIEVDGEVNENMNVFVSVDGEVTNLDLSPAMMKNPEELRELLADVPEEIREKLIANLSREFIHDGNFKIIVDGDVNQELHWLSESDNEANRNIEVIVDDGSEEEVVHRVIKKVLRSSHHKNVHAIRQGNISADSLLDMIKQSDYNADELNKIQQALDAKR